jgi:O-antigen ligase
VLLVLILLLIPPFLFTQSRSSYLAFIPACLALGLMSDKRIIILALLALSFLVSPLFLPSPVKNRIMYTFNQPESEGQIVIGDIRLDTSTSARIKSWEEVLRDWPRHPLLGYGVTGYSFVDAQLPRVLIETGVVGLAAFLYLLFSVFKLAIANLRGAQNPLFKGIGVGFIAGLVGLVVHSIGANTFIIVRIMEPFWFFAGIIAVMPELEALQPRTADVCSPATRRAVAG